ncbi:hypothetical protein CONLIGDRAFT_683797 [Coniochaeta ligniaria NRRL 30616]|uniref:Uncharacterized protein n=1 Tax=Coniochaeta ligniaria NRRL 30616 TaxID=1408157 RepID=A0A1J7IHA9_9PEZI|nr:hypothetical protein CONLIGDRAFT_683797 [Coniochaeta ligniaria NRRL 30616]
MASPYPSFFYFELNYTSGHVEDQGRIPGLKKKRREQLLKQLSRILPGKPRSEHAATRDLIPRLKALEKFVDRAPDAIAWDSADIGELTIISRAEIEAFLFAQDYTGETGVSSTIEQLEKFGFPIHDTDGNREWKASLPTEYAEKTMRDKQIYTLGVDGCLSPNSKGNTKRTFTVLDTSDIFQVFSVAPLNKETGVNNSDVDGDTTEDDVPELLSRSGKAGVSESALDQLQEKPVAILEPDSQTIKIFFPFPISASSLEDELLRHAEEATATWKVRTQALKREDLLRNLGYKSRFQNRRRILSHLSDKTAIDVSDPFFEMTAATPRKSNETWH